jgi:ribonucleotide reductase alpha subunit
LSLLDKDGYIKDPYRNFIAISRYARWDEGKNRRETWAETVDRYMVFMREYLQKNNDYSIEQNQFDAIKDSVINMQVLPSLRALMTSGKALEKSAIASYNCSYLPIDSIKSFDELMFILMCGTGCGVSVEQKYTNMLPTVSIDLEDSDHMIVIADNREGWAKSLRVLISTLYAGQIPQFDFSKVRKAGERLKTFGGRASGSEPLRQLFNFIIKKFEGARGRKLSPLECHDIVCKIGEVVIAGSVRRSAIISFSDLSDKDMAEAKNGQFWIDNAQRSMANNSAVYYGKPDVKTFLREWNSLIESGSGERGIFNLKAAQKQAAKYGLRDSDIEYKSNPCLASDTLLLTSEGLQRIGDLCDKDFEIFNGDGKFAQSSAWYTGDKPVYSIKLSNGQEIKLTKNHVIEVMTKTFPSQEVFNKSIELTVGDLEPGMKVKPFYNQLQVHTGGIDVPNAELYGLLFGDGYIQKNGGTSVYIKTGEKEVIEFLHKTLGDRISITEDNLFRIKDMLAEMQAYGFSLSPLPQRQYPESIFTWSAKSLYAFLRGQFSANGGAMPKHNRIDLKATCYKMVQDCQRLLSALGFSSYITTNKESEIQWSNGTYISKQSYDLNISGAYQYSKFQKEIGFQHEHKSLECHGDPNKKFKSRIVDIISIDYIGIEAVYDFSEPITHWGWANGFKIHNCSEILLKPYSFCNLSSIPVAGNETLEELKDKVELATILGTWQACIIHFHYLKKEWKQNAEEERLLGVSLSGIFGHAVLNGSQGLEKTAEWLDELRLHARKVNEKLAPQLGINISAAITCVKPEGNSSQLTNTSSGIHPWHSEYYIRTVRSDSKDPLGQFLKDSGIPCEPDLMKPEVSEVFSFPIKSPKNALTRKDITALEHLELWLTYQRHWCEHKPSITVNVKEDEWLDVGKWVYDNFDEVSGISFLPYADHVYQQAPYQEITEAQYNEAVEKMPKELHWSLLAHYENDDAAVIGGRELACSAGGCEVVDLIT